MEYIEKKVAVPISQNVGKKKAFVLACQKLWRSRWTADISLLLVALIWGTTYRLQKTSFQMSPYWSSYSFDF